MDPLSSASSLQKTIFMDFLKDMEAYLDVNAEPVSVVDLWSESPPEQAEGVAISEYLGADV
jgi:hypothetical protein